MAAQDDVFKKIVSHCKEYGFVFPASEIYDGPGAVYDYGPYGSQLRNHIKDYWWKAMVQMHENIVGIDAAIFMHPTTWKASGHVDAFNDPLVDNKDSKKRYRADVLIEDYIAKLEEKINKEAEKGRKKFGEAFDERLGSGNSIVAGPIGSKLYALARIPSTGVKAYYRKYANQSLFANQQVRSEICKRFLQPGDTLVVDGSSNPKIQLKTGSFILLEWHHSPNHIGSLSLISCEDHRLGANYAALHFESRLGGNQMFNVRYGQ